MDEVVGHVEELHGVLDQEQASDEERRSYCERELREAVAGRAGRERDVEDAKSILASFQVR